MIGKRGQTKGTFGILLGGLILISIFSILFFSLLTQSQQSYSSVTFNSTQYQAFDESNTVINLTADMNDQFTSLNSTGTNVGDIINVVTTGGYNTIRIIGATPAFYADILTSIAAVFGIPTTIVSLVITIIIGALLGLFILLVFRVAVI